MFNEKYIVVTDFINDVTNSRKIVNACVVITQLLHEVIHRITAKSYDKKVQVGKDQEKAQSEKDSHSKNRGGKKQN